MNNAFPNYLDSDLDWLAFCYAAGELSPAEAEQFESRLASEQPAREALARAVEVTQAVAVAESQPCGNVVTPAARTRTKWSTRLSWMAIGGLASLLLALVWSGSFTPQKTAALRSNAEQQRNLAAAWSEARAEIASAKEDGTWPTIAMTTPDADSDSSGSGSDDLNLGESPAWMTTAVLGLAGMSSDDEAGE